MRQTTTAEVRLDHGKAAGSGITSGRSDGWLPPEAVAIEFRCGGTSRDRRSGPTGWESGECPRNSIGIFEAFHIEARNMPHTVVAMYDVDGSVGRGGANFSPDVMLVQFFFSAMALDAGWNTSPFFSNNFMLDSGPAPIFPINGVYQPALADWIESFQAQANRDTTFGPLVVDGRVTPAETGWFRRQHPPHRRTIQVMNHILFISNQKRFERLDSDPWAPGALQGALRTFRHNL